MMNNNMNMNMNMNKSLFLKRIALRALNNTQLYYLLALFEYWRLAIIEGILISAIAYANES